MCFNNNNSALQSQLEQTTAANEQLQATLAAGSQGESARLAADARRRQLGAMKGFASSIVNKNGFAAAAPAVQLLSA